MARHRADLDAVLRRLDPGQILDRSQVDEIARRGEAQLHRLHQALPAREEPRLVAL